MIFYAPLERKWLFYCRERKVTREATAIEIDVHIQDIIDYLRAEVKIPVTDKLPKSAQVACELIRRFGLPMTERELVSLLYLCDWRHCLTQDRQITNIHWTRKIGATPVIGNESPDLWGSIMSFDWVNDRYCVALVEENVEIDLERTELDAIAHCYGACSKMNLLEFTTILAESPGF